MKIELIATGDEIVNGSLTDTNSGWMASRLMSLGHEVIGIHAVGDDLERIESLLIECAGRSEAVICAGGLGPTSDDLTSEAAANAMGVKLVLFENAWESIKERFARLNFPLAPTNKKQAMLPEGADMMENPIGTAPGYMVRIKGVPFFFAPGVPVELFRMFDEQILPRLAKIDSEPAAYATRVWRTFGHTESGLGDILKDIPGRNRNIRLAFRASFPEIRVTLTARAANGDGAERLLAELAEEVDGKIGQWAFSRDGRSLPEVVGDLLRDQGMKIALAESCTGGLIGKMLTDIPGSSDYLHGGAIAYSNALKRQLLSVPASLLEEYGAVSEEVARAMAEGVRKNLGVDVGLGVTGIAGPTGGTPEKPVGTVYMACATKDGVDVRGGQWPRGDREQIRLISAFAALDLVRKTIDPERR